MIFLLDDAQSRTEILQKFFCKCKNFVMEVSYLGKT